MSEEKDFKLIIIDKAQAIFSKYGYRKTTMNDIAVACNKSKALLYHYFKNKDDIIREIILKETNFQSNIVKESINDTDSVRDQLVAYVRMVTYWFNNKTEDNYMTIKDIFDYIELINDIVLDFFYNLKDVLKLILLNGQKSGILKILDVDMTTEYIFQMIFGLNYTPLGRILKISEGKYQSPENFVDTILHGLLKR